MSTSYLGFVQLPLVVTKQVSCSLNIGVKKEERKMTLDLFFMFFKETQKASKHQELKLLFLAIALFWH